MWKSFFFYPKGDRIAILILSALILCVLSVMWLLPERPITEGEGMERPDSVMLVYRDSLKHHSKAFQNRDLSRVVKSEPVQFFLFDPNRADSLTLAKLGLPSFVVRNILRYRLRGGIFRTPESLGRIYGMDEELYKRLLPYVRVEKAAVAPIERKPDKLSVFRMHIDTVRRKYSEGTVVNLNSVDTTELKRVPGIASSLSRQIVAYRNRLGGFYRVEQLQEVSPYLSVEMNRWFFVTDSVWRKMLINKADVAELRRHPYLNFYQARRIVEHRRKWGKLVSLRQLELYDEFTPADLERLSHYVEF